MTEHSDQLLLNTFEYATKLWHTNTTHGKCASLDIMKHLTQMGFKFAGAEQAYEIAITDNHPVIHQAAVELLAALLQQQKGMIYARQIINNLTLNPSNVITQKDAIHLFSKMIDHCDYNINNPNINNHNEISKLEFPDISPPPNIVIMIGGIISGILLLKIFGYKLCIHRIY